MSQKLSDDGGKHGLPIETQESAYDAIIWNAGECIMEFLVMGWVLCDRDRGRVEVIDVKCIRGALGVNIMDYVCKNRI